MPRRGSSPAAYPSGSLATPQAPNPVTLLGDVDHLEVEPEGPDDRLDRGEVEGRQVVDHGPLDAARRRPAVRLRPGPDRLDPHEERLAGLLGDHLAEERAEELDLAGERIAGTGRPDPGRLGQDRRIRPRPGPGSWPRTRSPPRRSLPAHGPHRRTARAARGLRPGGSSRQRSRYLARGPARAPRHVRVCTEYNKTPISGPCQPHRVTTPRRFIPSHAQAIANLCGDSARSVSPTLETRDLLHPVHGPANGGGIPRNGARRNPSVPRCRRQAGWATSRRRCSRKRRSTALPTRSAARR